MKDINSDHIFNSPWPDTVLGAFFKYPNPSNPNVLYDEIISREIDCHGRLCSRKILYSKFNPNYLMRQVMNIIKMPIKDYQLSLEHSTLNLERRSYKMNSLNKTYLDWIKVY